MRVPMCVDLPCWACVLWQHAFTDLSSHPTSMLLCCRAFKFAPLLGKCLAEMTLNREPTFDTAPLDPGRECLNYGADYADPLFPDRPRHAPRAAL